MELNFSDSDLDALADRLAVRLLDRIKEPSATPGNEKILFTEAEAAERLSVSKYTLKRWREEGYVEATSPKKPVRYSAADIEKAADWMKTRGQK